ncbi:MAG: ribosome maturation factor RimP [Desulfobacterales bacterium]|nr:MAG: ribosome maturation factor RimP [Desulfobacterales bacterium]
MFKAPVKTQKGSSKKKSTAKGHAPFSPANAQRVIARVEALAEPLCLSEGLELVHVEYQRESAGRILRLYIDKTGGVTLEDCAEVSRQLGDLLDVKLEDIGPYNLEVTSPGPDRPLAKKRDFERFTGHLARIKMVQPVDGQKNFKGVILDVSEEQVAILVDGKTVAIPLNDISKARLVNYNGEV